MKKLLCLVCQRHLNMKPTEKSSHILHKQNWNIDEFGKTIEAISKLCLDCLSESIEYETNINIGISKYLVRHIETINKKKRNKKLNTISSNDREKFLLEIIIDNSFNYFTIENRELVNCNYINKNLSSALFIPQSYYRHWRKRLKIKGTICNSDKIRYCHFINKNEVRKQEIKWWSSILNKSNWYEPGMYSSTIAVGRVFPRWIDYIFFHDMTLIPVNINFRLMMLKWSKTYKRQRRQNVDIS